MDEYHAKLATPFAVLGITIQDVKLTGIDFLPLAIPPVPPQDAVSREVCNQLERYLHNPASNFSLPLVLVGTEFQKRVWGELLAIPCGATISYTELAQRVGSGARAVANACGANNVPIIIPCHRVVAKHGLGGFMRGREANSLSIKQWLLAHERG